MFFRRFAGLLGAACLAALMAACGLTPPDNSALGQIKPDQTVYADLWDESAEEGDRALVEQKPSGLWVIDTSVNFRNQRQSSFDVHLKLDKSTGTFVIIDMGKTLVGKDHDDCLSLNEPEHYAVMNDASVTFEKNVPAKNSNDDCLVATDTN